VAVGFSTPASAIEDRLTVSLDKTLYRKGELMTLSVNEDFRKTRYVHVTDTGAHTWKKVFDDGLRQIWTAAAEATGDAVVTVKLTVERRTSPVHVATTAFRVVSLRSTRVGMSSPAHLWSQRIAEVGVGVSARRIFADLGKGSNDQMELVEAAHRAGMMPVISYKVGGDAAGAAAGKYNAVAEQAATRLESYGLPTTVTYWHEPHGDLAPAQFVAGNKQLLPAFKRGKIKVGPFLNGWLLDRLQPTFGSYCPDELFGLWDWFGIDTYESGTMESPGDIKPADRIPKLVSYVNSRGFSHRLGIGEYNGYSAQSIFDAGNAILDEQQIAFGCMWNSTIGKGYALTGARLEAFRTTLADPRAAEAA
jgi:hypothetical protein